MIRKGQKRKLPPEEVEVPDRSSPTWENQRQFVFSISMSKYQRGQELPEPSLRRSVLIANTLRQINLEASSLPSVESETLQPLCSSSSALQAKEQESNFTLDTEANHHSAVANNHSALDSCPQLSSDAAELSNCTSIHSSATNVPLDAEEEDEDWGSMSTDLDASLSAAISSILTALDSTIDGSPQAASRTPLRSLENLSEPSEGSVAGGKQGVRAYGSSSDQQEENRAEESSMEAMTSSYLSDVTLEDLFQDIDTSLLENDLGLFEFRGSGSGYTAEDDFLWYPCSLPINQNLMSLPSFSSFSPSSSSQPPSHFSGQSHVKEVLELEHLMEIPVES